MSAVPQNLNREPRPQVIRPIQQSVPTQTTSLCRLKIIENVFTTLKNEYHQLTYQCALPEPSEWVYNALAYKVTTGISDVLDSITRFCNDYHRLEGASSPSLHFKDFVFQGDHLLKLQSYQRQLNALKYQGLDLFRLAHKLKHEVAWVGILANDTEKSLVDIFDTRRVGLIHEILHGAMGITENIIRILLAFLP